MYFMSTDNFLSLTLKLFDTRSHAYSIKIHMKINDYKSNNKILFTHVFLNKENPDLISNICYAK